ncbi:MAG: hypothetical protein OER88_07510, partial [Planctomycetota bacterium]|nr:hypothetical protein [Planctomycetota bacterium]
MRRAVAIVLLAALAGAQDPGAAPPHREISLRDAIELGLAYNLGLRSSRFGALMARLDVDAANAAWDVTVT